MCWRGACTEGVTLNGKLSRGRGEGQLRETETERCAQGGQVSVRKAWRAGRWPAPPATPRRRTLAAQSPPRPPPRTCFRGIPKRPSVENQRESAGAARRSRAEQELQKQQQQKAPLPHHGRRTRPAPPRTVASGHSRAT